MVSKNNSQSKNIIPYFKTEIGELYHGDSLDIMKGFSDNHFSTIITDPPYGLFFMGKNWDRGIPGIPFWKEALRICKPGTLLFAFGGARTHHRLMCAIEDAGWEIRDSLLFWIFGSGFPKSHNISKAIDLNACKKQLIDDLGRNPTNDELKTAWNKFQKTVGKRRHPTLKNIDLLKEQTTAAHGENVWDREWDIKIPKTPDAQKWNGYGTALKPAHEIIVIAMKPLDGTFAQNALKYGVAGLNIDAGRIKTNESTKRPDGKCKHGSNSHSPALGVAWNGNGMSGDHSLGRWPANVILTHHPECEMIGTKKIKVPRHRDGYLIKKDNFGGTRSKNPLGKNDHSHPDGTEIIENWNCHPDCPVRILDEQSGERKAGGKVKGTEPSRTGQNEIYNLWNRVENFPHDDMGTASRFFYCAKASRSERNKGLKTLGLKNKHPTVKPVDLIKYLLKLTKMPGNDHIALDLFSGSGTLPVACEEMNRKYIAIEIEEKYCEISVGRTKDAIKQRKLFK